jgi:hypothetical protein
VVTTPTAEFYKNGPAQDSSFQVESLRNLPSQNVGPDLQLSKGTAVTLLKREWGFSRVIADNGAVGYVANEQLRSAPVVVSRAVAKKAPSSKPMKRRNKQAPERQQPESLDLSDIPLPLPI